MTAPAEIDVHRLLADAKAAINAGRALHPTPAELAKQKAESRALCPTCIMPAPCSTRRALDGEDTAHG